MLIHALHKCGDGLILCLEILFFLIQPILEDRILELQPVNPLLKEC